MNCPTFGEQFKTEVFLLPAKNSPSIKKNARTLSGRFFYLASNELN